MTAQETVGKALASTLNRVVALDPEARRKLRKLEGRTVGIELTGPGIRFALGVEDGRFGFGPIEAIEPDATIRATPGAFVAMAGSGGQAAAGNIELAGDTETARRFQQFFSELSPDFEEAATRIFGDVIGFQVSRLVAGGMKWARESSWRFAEDVSEYLREESRQLVNEPEMEAFLDAVDDLRDDVERLSVRVDKLKRRR